MVADAIDSADTAALRRMRDALGALAPAVDDADRIERVRLLQELKAVAAAAQALEARDFRTSQVAEQAAVGVPAARQGRGVAGQLGLAMRVSPYRAQQFLGFATVVTSELPATFAQLRAGRVSEWRATLVARETAWLSREHRAQVDTELAGQLEGWGDRQVEAETKKAGYRLDPAGYVAHLGNAERDRRVTLRPAPDTMARLSLLLPVAQGVAALAALQRAADSCRAAGDARSRGQVMADTAVARLTGQAHADQVPVEVHLVMPAETLLHGGDEPAVILGYGPVPAPWARTLATTADAPRWIRRLYRTPGTGPGTGQLAAMDSRRRLFTEPQKLFLRLRDEDTCRTPYCDAPLAHADHIHPHQHGGPTSVGNGRGACAGCNHTTQAPGWTAHRDPDTGTITTTTPTGHHYDSPEPPPPRQQPPRRRKPRRPGITVDLEWWHHAA